MQSLLPASTPLLKTRMSLFFIALMALSQLGADCIRAQQSSSSDPIIELVRKVTPAVVKLQVMDVNGRVIKIGSGFFISADGQLVTNKHVIAGASRVAITSQSGAHFTVEETLAVSKDADVVLLRTTARNTPFLALGNTDQIEAGARIIVVGNPLSLEGTVSEGIISAKRQTKDEGMLVQITAPISHGSSGSPVIGRDGRVVGVVSSFRTGGQNLNFAVAVSEITNLSSLSGRLQELRKMRAEYFQKNGFPRFQNK